MVVPYWMQQPDSQNQLSIKVNTTYAYISGR